MKKLLVALLLLSIALPMRSWADHIGLYSDRTGASCVLATGFNTEVAIIHKFSLGATGSRFRVELPAGSTLFLFNSPYVGAGQPPSTLLQGVQLTYPCLNTTVSGNLVLGTLVAILSLGYARVLPAVDQTSVVYYDCDGVEKQATGGEAAIGINDDPCRTFDPWPPPNPVQQSTWGNVKALYRD